MSIYEKVIARRTTRKYRRAKVPDDVVRKCVDAARMSPISTNHQSLKYVIVNDENLVAQIFRITTYALLLPKYKPSEAEMPDVFIVILSDETIQGSKTPWVPYDVGIATMSISMVAFDEGIGSCILASTQRNKLREILNIPDHLRIDMLVSLGYPGNERHVIDKPRNGDVKYWVDDKEVLHVPKRRLEDILTYNRF